MADSASTASQIINDKAMAEAMADDVAEDAEIVFQRGPRLWPRRAEALQRDPLSRPQPSRIAEAMAEGRHNWVLIESGHGEGYDLANPGRPFAAESQKV